MPGSLYYERTLEKFLPTHLQWGCRVSLVFVFGNCLWALHTLVQSALNIVPHVTKRGVWLTHTHHDINPLPRQPGVNVEGGRFHHHMCWLAVPVDHLRKLSADMVAPPEYTLPSVLMPLSKQSWLRCCVDVPSSVLCQQNIEYRYSKLNKCVLCIIIIGEESK